MFLLDANVLIYAFRRDSPHHAACYEWLVRALAGDEPVATTSIVELALLRITTLRSLGKAAAAPAEAFRFLDVMKAQPAAIRLEPGESHQKNLRRAVLEPRTARQRPERRIPRGPRGRA